MSKKSPVSNAGTPNFEAALAELEAIVSAMESGNMPLEESLAKYQRGIELLRECNATLSAAEQKVALLESGKLRDIEPGELRSSGNDES